MNQPDNHQNNYDDRCNQLFESSGVSGSRIMGVRVHYPAVRRRSLEIVYNIENIGENFGRALVSIYDVTILQGHNTRLVCIFDSPQIVQRVRLAFREAIPLIDPLQTHLWWCVYVNVHVRYMTNQLVQQRQVVRRKVL